MDEKLADLTDKAVSKDGSQTPSRSRPRLPSFSPRECETFQNKEDCKNFSVDVDALKRVDFVKMYSRSRALTPCRMRELSMLSVSPVRSATIQSSEDTPSKSGRKLRRSLSLKLLTYKLISGKESSSLQNIPNPQFNLQSSKSEDRSGMMSPNFLVDYKMTKSANKTCGDENKNSKKSEAASVVSADSDCTPSLDNSMESSVGNVMSGHESPHTVKSIPDSENSNNNIPTSHGKSNLESSNLSVDETNDIHTPTDDDHDSNQTDERFVSSLLVTGLSIPKVQSSDQDTSCDNKDNTNKNVPDSSLDDEGLDDEGLYDDTELPPSLYEMEYNGRTNKDSERKISKDIPQRRTGAMSVIMSGNAQRMLAVSHEQRKDADSIEEVMMRRQPRFVTHPPHRKTAIMEVGSMDSNGLGTLKSDNKHTEPKPQSSLKESVTSLTDSHTSFGDSDIDVECANSEFSDSEKQKLGSSKRERFSDAEKKKSDSIDLGSKIDEFSDSEKRKSGSIDLGCKTDESLNIVSREGTPLLICEEDLAESKTLVGLKKRSSSTNVLTKQSSSSSSTEELKVPQLAVSTEQQSEHLKHALTKKKYSESGFPRRLSPRLDRCHGGRFSTTVPQLMTKSVNTERSMSSSEKLHRPYTLLLSVPPPKKPIFRSMSSASALHKERRIQSTSAASSKDEVEHKYGEDHGSDRKLGASVPNFLSPFPDTKLSLASSMPDVTWEEDCKDDVPVLESPDVEMARVEIKDKRYMIVEELYHNEQEYVDALQTLKDKYMRPLKVHNILDENVVDDIFYMIPEILTHHLIYHSFLDRVWKNWDSKQSTVGDIIIGIFSKQTVLNSYLSFVENYKTSGKVIEHALQTKSSVMKFVNKCQSESGTKLSLKDLIVRPIQRIPRYELLIERLSQHTPKDHPDGPLLAQAQKVMHELALKIGTANEGQPAQDLHATLKKLEIILMTELAVPERMYLKHDIVEIVNKKDACCLWLFSDVLIVSSVKRKTGTVTRKSSVILKSPSGQDFVDNVKHKVWLQVSLDDVEVLKGANMTRGETFDKEQVEDDLAVMAHIDEWAQKLSCKHQYLTDVIKDVCSNLHKQLVNPPYSSFAADSCKLEILVTTQEGVLNLLVTFPSAEKRVFWEILFTEAKQKLAQYCDKRAPEFLQPLQITKTRAGMQFSCASSIDGLNRKGHRDVWVCNSDGYVGHVCLLSLQPEPIVTLNTPIPGCHSRILCIASVPSFSGPFRRKGSKRSKESPPQDEIREGDEGEGRSGADEDGYQSDSDTSDDEPLAFRTPQIYLRDGDESGPGEMSMASPTSPGPAMMDHRHISTSGAWTQDPLKSTMWLGTEDGCIHIFQCTDNIKTTKNKLKIQHGATVLCIVYLDNKVFVALANGELNMYKRDQEGLWECEEPTVKMLGNTLSPISKMTAVAGRLWCGVQGSVSVINPNTLQVEKSFVVMPESNKSVECIVCSGHGVWITCRHTSRVYLYHATTYEFLLSVNVAQAVSQKLQSADDIIRQHKTACLRITALLVCKDLLWVGTSAGVVLTLPVVKVTSTTKRGMLTAPSVTGLVYGHTGHVRFLTSVDLSSTTSSQKDANDESSQERALSPELQRRVSMAVSASLMANRMLVISGGDGYEDFRANAASDMAGRDDSTNHLLLWQV